MPSPHPYGVSPKGKRVNEITLNRRWWAVALAIASCFCLLGMANTAQAATHEEKFCWEEVITPSDGCNWSETEGLEGIHRWTYAVHVRGVSHSVCVTDVMTKQKACSGGPGEDAWITMTPSSEYVWPMISVNNGKQGVSTKVYGWVHYQDPPPSGGGTPPPPPATWHLDYLGGSIASKPAVASWSANRLDIFAKDTDSSLLTKVWDGVQWSGWIDLGGQLSSGPSAVSWGPGRIDVVARVADNSIGHWWYANGSWNYDNMGGLGGNFTSDPGISSWAPGRLDVFARGGISNKLFHAYYDGTWKGWEDMGGNLASGPAAVSWDAGRIDVVAVAADKSLQHWYWGGAGWATDNLGGCFQSEPGIASWAPGRLDIFTRGCESNKLFHKWYAGTYSGWEDMGGTLTSGISAVSWANNRIDVVSRATDNSVPHWWWG